MTQPNNQFFVLNNVLEFQELVQFIKKIKNFRLKPEFQSEIESIILKAKTKKPIELQEIRTVKNGLKRLVITFLSNSVSFFERKISSANLIDQDLQEFVAKKLKDHQQVLRMKGDDLNLCVESYNLIFGAIEEASSKQQELIKTRWQRDMEQKKMKAQAKYDRKIERRQREVNSEFLIPENLFSGLANLEI